MTILVGINVFSITCLIFVSLLKTSYSFDVDIKATALDFKGRDSPLLYDGGSVKIRCLRRYGSKPIELYVAKSTSNSSFTRFAVGNDVFIERKVSIDSTTLLNRYKCISGNEESVTLEISYALCSQRSVKPRRVCPKDHEFCQITKNDSTTCKPLDERSCFYGVGRDQLAMADVLSAFPVVCGAEPGGTSRLGLCNSLSSPHFTHQFLTNAQRGCNSELSVKVCNVTCKNGRQLDLAGWNFVDLAKPASVVVSFKGLTYNYNFSCQVTYGENSTIKAHNLTKPFRGILTTKIIPFEDPIKPVPTPIIADIVCGVHTFDDTYFLYQTNLLLFRSDTDITYTIIDVEPGIVFGKVVYRVTIKVEAAEGLYVCAAEEKAYCHPNGSRNVRRLEIITPHREDGNSAMVRFYVGLFASSPKEKYVLIYDRTVNRIAGFPNSGRSRILGLSNRTRSVARGSLGTIGFTAVVVSATILGITVITIVTIIIIWVMYKRDKKGVKTSRTGERRLASK